MFENAGMSAVQIPRVVAGARRYSLLEDLAHAGTFRADFEHDTILASAGFSDLFGFGRAAHQIPVKKLLARIPRSEMRAVRHERDRARASGVPCRFRHHVILPDKTRRYVETEAVFEYDDQGHPTSYIGASADITGVEKAACNLQRARLYDDVTSLAKRNAFVENLQHILLRAHGGIYAVIEIDLDAFGHLNDTLGSLSGDLVLKAVGSRLSKAHASILECGRIGGDEFACVAGPFRKRSEVEEVVDAIDSALSAPIALGDSELRISACLGIALYPRDGKDIVLVDQAHLALAHAKAKGQGAAQWYEKAFAREIARRYELARELRVALAREEFDLYYQPIVDEESNAVCFEALLRWKHPQRGMLTPDQFLHVAEETGVIERLGKWQLRRVCDDAAELHRRLGGPVRMHVNVTAAQLMDRQFLPTLDWSIRQSGIPSEAIAIEVTEHHLLSGTERAGDVLARLRERHIDVAVDDFGTGYNTFKYLQRYPVNVIKIDQGFVRDVHANAYSRAICSTILQLANTMGIHVIAEGVETTSQRDVLRQLGCTAFQGYLYGRPAPLSEHYERAVQAVS